LTSDIEYFPFGDTSRHKSTQVSFFVFVIYWMLRKIERCLCRLVSLKHLLYIELYIECHKLKLNMKTEKDQRRVITTMPVENAALEFFDISCNVYLILHSCERW